MTGINGVAAALESLRAVNDLTTQRQQLPGHLRHLLKHAIPRLPRTSQPPSVAFIVSDLWFGNKHAELATAVTQKCFHADQQSRRIIGVVQAYGCGKTKTGLRLSDAYILLPIRFNVSSVSATTLVDDVVVEQKRLLDALPQNPTYQQVQAFSDQCQRLVHVCLFALVALYDACISEQVIDGANQLDRFHLALLLLMDHPEVVVWCRGFFEQHKAAVQNDQAFQQLVAVALDTQRHTKIVFLMDEVHVLFGHCRGYTLHATDKPVALTEVAIEYWRREQVHGQSSTGHRSCTDLFYQFRVVMLKYLLQGVTPFGFVMCSTMFRVWKVLEEENSPLSRGTIDQFFRLHWFTHDEIKAAVRAMFDVSEANLDALERAADGSRVQAYKRLSVYSRPLFLMEFLEQLCVTFSALPNTSTDTLQAWLRQALTTSEQTTMTRARDQIETLVVSNPAVDVWTTRQIVHLLYTTQRLCGGTLELSPASDESTLENIIAKGVARLDIKASRFRISDAIFAEALVQLYGTLQARNTAVIKMLAQNTSLHQALTSHDSSHKGFLVERLLAWLALTAQLKLTVYDQQGDRTASVWTVSTAAQCAGTLPELERGETSADEPRLLAKIMKGRARYVLLPTTLAGPDLWMRGMIDGVDSIVAVQSKAEDKVYSLRDFKTALKSLDPIRMYRANAARAAREKWQRHLADLRAMTLHRIVFSACGFNAEVQYAVREYNLLRGRQAPTGEPRCYIHLLHLDDLHPYIGALYEILKAQFTTNIQSSLTTDAVMLAHEWCSKTKSQRKEVLMPELREHCKYRGIVLEGKRRPQLEKALDDYCAQTQLVQLLTSFDPNFQ